MLAEVLDSDQSLSQTKRSQSKDWSIKDIVVLVGHVQMDQNSHVKYVTTQPFRVVAVCTSVPQGQSSVESEFLKIQALSRVFMHSFRVLARAMNQSLFKSP